MNYTLYIAMICGLYGIFTSLIWIYLLITVPQTTFYDGSAPMVAAFVVMGLCEIDRRLRALEQPADNKLSTNDDDDSQM